MKGRLRLSLLLRRLLFAAALLCGTALLHSGCIFDADSGFISAQSDSTGADNTTNEADTSNRRDTADLHAADYTYQGGDLTDGVSEDTAYQYGDALDDTSKPSNDTVVVEDAVDVGVCEGPGFAVNPLGWSIPFPATRPDTPSSGSPTRFHILRDMDGDERPDLVLTYRADEGAGWDNWLVYINNGDGFKKTPLSWPIPFKATRPDTLYVENPLRRYLLRDMDGDKRPDLVVTYVYDQNVGSTNWLVYRNTGSGFETTPLNWPVPFSARWPDTLDADSPVRSYTLRDMDGDLRPDLLVTFVYGQTVGSTHWLVHLNNGSGFSNTALNWPVPFKATRPDTLDVDNPVRRYTLRDMDGDRRPDLLVTFIYNQDVGSDSWLVYLNSGSAFSATPLSWPVPFKATRPDTLDADNPVRSYTLRDMDGDRRPDLLVTYVYDNSVGWNNWLVYRNSGSGFTKIPLCWPIPFRATLPDTPLDASNPLRIYTLRDMDGDLRPELVLSYSYSSPIANDTWQVYVNSSQ